MELPSVTVVLHNKTDKKGLSVVMIRVIYQRKILHKSTGLKADPSMFSNERLYFPTVPNAPYKNKRIKDKVAAIEKQYLKLAEDKLLDLISVKQVLTDGETGVQLVKDVIQKIIDKYENTLAPNTMKGWKSVKTKIQEYKPGLSLSQLDESTMQGFQAFMRTEYTNQHNTIAGTLKRLETMLKKAKKLGIISVNPLEEYTAPSYKQTKRTYLTEDEVKKIAAFSDKTESLYFKSVCKWFLLGCYSGLRLQDLERWNEQKMVTGDRLYFSDQKTGNPHYIPLYKELKTAIKNVRDVRAMPTGQQCNRALKEIAGMCSIDKNITMHVARHSFAVMWLDKGGSIEVLQPLMGHKKINTTQIYGKITDRRITTEARRVFG